MATEARSLVYLIAEKAPYGALKVVPPNGRLSLYRNYDKVALLTSAGSSN